MKLIIGLGNPGKEHLDNRHNLGFMVVDEYAKKYAGATIEWQTEQKFKAEILKISPELWLVKPLTFMNNSGMTVSALINYYKLSAADLVIVYDELDLPLGKIKVRIGGAAAGHHGVESIMESIATDRFIRLRIGIGNQQTENAEHKNAHVDVNRYVLSEFNHSERPKLKHIFKQVLQALNVLLEKGLEVAQNQYN